jgi:hypothetical protein
VFDKNKLEIYRSLLDFLQKSFGQECPSSKNKKHYLVFTNKSFDLLDL